MYAVNKGHIYDNIFRDTLILPSLVEIIFIVIQRPQRCTNLPNHLIQKEFLVL